MYQVQRRFRFIVLLFDYLMIITTYFCKKINKPSSPRHYTPQAITFSGTSEELFCIKDAKPSLHFVPLPDILLIFFFTLSRVIPFLPHRMKWPGVIEGLYLRCTKCSSAAHTSFLYLIHLIHLRCKGERSGRGAKLCNCIHSFTPSV